MTKRAAEKEPGAGRHTYSNPVHNRPCPDPFALKYLDQYWCYCTGFWHDGRCFGVLHSPDLVEWRELGGAMAPLDDVSNCYWAPEVIYDNGRFLMYYSVGNEERMQIRVAVAEHPAGPFIDSGRRLTSEEFAIDPHVFVDDDGTRYLFYATDFLTHTHIGTGTVCDRMIDAFTLAGEPRPVTRARFDWQVYDPQRAEKGGVRWHTIEGPAVLKHKRRYYQMFSGGNWKHGGYGVSYAASDRVVRDDEWEQVADGERVLPILRTVAGEVIGPGHNSVVRGPDNVQLYCVYHRWHHWRREQSDHESEESGYDRVLSIDPLDWVGERMIIIGPSTAPQAAPIGPSFRDRFEKEAEGRLGEGWRCAGGRWQAGAGVARQSATDGSGEARCLRESPYFTAELSLRLAVEESADAEAGAGIDLDDERGRALRCRLLPHRRSVKIWKRVEEGSPDGVKAEGGGWQSAEIALPSSFDFSAFHLLRVEANARSVMISIDENAARFEGLLGARARAIALATDKAAAEFAAFALTAGWQDLFINAEADLAALGWRSESGDGAWRLNDGALLYEKALAMPSLLAKGPLPRDYELIVNARLVTEGEMETGMGAGMDAREGARYGIMPAMAGDERGPLLTIEREAGVWALCCETQTYRQTFPLPSSFDPSHFQHFRIRKEGEVLRIRHEAHLLGEVAASGEANLIGLCGYGSAVAFDLVRVTAIG